MKYSTSTAECLLGNGKCNGVLSALAKIVGCSHRPVMGCHQQNHYEGNINNIEKEHQDRQQLAHMSSSQAPVMGANLNNPVCKL